MSPKSENVSFSINSGECHCKNDFLEKYDDKNRLHCYQENSKGPCKDGQIFVQSDEVDENGVAKKPTCSDEYQFEIRRLIDGRGFENVCANGRRRDKTTGRCAKTFRHKSNLRRTIGGHRNVMEFLRFRRKHRQ